MRDKFIAQTFRKSKIKEKHYFAIDRNIRFPTEHNILLR